MKAYKHQDGDDIKFVFNDEKDDTLFTFSVSWPDYHTLQLCETSFGYDVQPKIVSSLKPVDEQHHREFNRIFNQKDNYNDVKDLLLEIFDTTVDEINHSLWLDFELADFASQLLKEYGDDDFYLYDVYRDVKEYNDLWNGDKDRIRTYMLRHGIERHTHHSHVMIDIWDCPNQNRRFLLHEYYASWGKDLDKILDKVIEKYPDRVDFDKAYYMCEELLEKQRENNFEKLKKKHEKK